MGSSKSKAKQKAQQAKRGPQSKPRGLVSSGIRGPALKAAGSDSTGWELKPIPVSGEPIEDLAVFARSSREQLDTALQAQATAVAEALEQLQMGNDAAALEGLKSIPRQSPLADWRLFIRGLVAFYQHDVTVARENWQRLDSQRRPARIATVLLAADRQPTLETLAHPAPAKLVQAAEQLRARPQVIAAARAIANIRSSNADQKFSMVQAARLTEFRDDYRRLDPDFVNRFSQACVRLACFQEHYEIFEYLKSRVLGPPHDPHWNLTASNYLSQFDGAEQVVDQAIESYIKTDLAKSKLTDEVQRALASLLRMIQAKQAMATAARSPMEMFSFFTDGPSIDYKAIEARLCEAIKLYPANRLAHLNLQQALQQQLEGRDVSKAAQAKIEARLVAAKEALFQAFPNDVETALWLIEQYFDDEHLPNAEKLIQQLANFRLVDLRTKALPWKLQLRMAMALSRRKTNLPQARQALDQAEQLWPDWLRRDWLPFLKAAVELRGGDRAHFEQLVATARNDGNVPPLMADFMSFAAAQQMNVPAADLKSLRTVVDKHLESATSTPLAELFQITSFFWQLTRAGMRYKAYRLHASKLGKVLCQRLNAGEAFELNTDFGDAASWCAAHGFWKTGYELRFPAWLTPHLAKYPRAIAAVIEWLHKASMGHFTLRKIEAERELLRQVAQSTSDAFDRQWFQRVEQEAQAKVAEGLAALGRGPMGGYWSQDDDDDDDYDYVDEDDDDTCDCDECCARRAREAALQSAAQAKANTSKKSAPDNQTKPKVSRERAIDRVLEKLAPKKGQQLLALMHEIITLDGDEDEIFPIQKRMLMLLLTSGISQEDSAAFFCALTGDIGDDEDDYEGDDAYQPLDALEQPPALPSTPMTATEKRDSRKQRQKELANRRKNR